MTNEALLDDRTGSARAASGSATTARQPAAESGVERLRTRISEELERLLGAVGSPASGSGRRTAPGGTAQATGASRELERRARFLGQVLAGLAGAGAEAFPPEGAALGSTVVVEDVDTGKKEQYTLMTGAVLEIDSDQVSLASPIGHALLGRKPGEVVVVETPQRTRRLKIVSLTRLEDLLGSGAPGE
jgi:transcription elongation GreA/GreB family factor